MEETNAVSRKILYFQRVVCVIIGTAGWKVASEVMGV
jgi:hypothetical protein